MEGGDGEMGWQAPGADLPLPSFRSQVALWLEVWSADRPDLVARARAVADPEVDPWGYLAELGQLLADAA